MSSAITYAPTAIGAGLAITGAAHFIAPQAFHTITVAAFPNDTATWITRNGATETAIGTAIAIPATRTLGWIGLGVYGAFLGSQILRTRLA